VYWPADSPRNCACPASLVLVVMFVNWLGDRNVTDARFPNGAPPSCTRTVICPLAPPTVESWPTVIFGQASRLRPNRTSALFIGNMPIAHFTAAPVGTAYNCGSTLHLTLAGVNRRQQAPRRREWLARHHRLLSDALSAPFLQRTLSHLRLRLSRTAIVV